VNSMTLPLSWSPSSEALNCKEFQACLAENKVVVIHFWAIWDNYDYTMDVTLQELSPRYKDKIKFLAADLDSEINWEIATACRVLNIPALGCYIEGKLHETLIGLRKKKDLGSLFDKWVAIANQ
jgi:thiol-disulfide isomerase/thioredoxin